MAVSKRLRYEILRRDNHTCRYCGAAAPDVPLRVDHVTPVALGGRDEPGNLVTACEPCNSGKSSTTADSTTVAAVSDDAIRWATAMRQAADNLRQQDTPKTEYRDAFLAEWNRWSIGKDKTKTVPLPEDWKQAMDRFRVAGVPAWMWPDIVDIGMANQKVKPDNTFRYCCGIAWNKVTELQAEAKKIVGAASATPSSAASFDVESIDDLVLEAAFLAWGQEWVCTFKRDPTPEEAAEFKASATQALSSGRRLPQILAAAEYAVWFDSANLAEGLKHYDHSAEFERQYVASLVFDSCWTQASGGERPSQEVSNQAWQNCVTLYEHGLHPVHVIAAAAFAGTHLTPVVHWGVSDAEPLNALRVLPGYQHAEDLWARTWRYAGPGPSWPSDEDRSAFRAALDAVHDENKYFYGDVYTAAVRAGAYRETDLRPHLALNADALAAAGFPCIGGDN
ncbi:HNH endonuclease [Streptomyces sp. V2]|uniref:HNH endonuclease n=1 Tax=Streptomyces sp. V2 TaxID=1424099 RepID=UPI0019D0B483|nr:HNH endonuclease [Streptomyces sp. V2]